MSTCQSTESGVRMELADGQVLEAELMLVAVGRGPQTSDLGCQEAGIELDDGFVRVNERLETSVPRVYAVGDVAKVDQGGMLNLYNSIPVFGANFAHDVLGDAGVGSVPAERVYAPKESETQLVP